MRYTLIDKSMRRRGQPVYVRVVVRLLSMAALLALPLLCQAAFRCGNALVSEGYRQHEVLEKCGEPDFRERLAGAYLEGIGAVDVTERWYYDMGSTRLVRILTFHHGRLRRIETGERGSSASTVDGSCQPYELTIGMSKYELLQRCGEPAARDSWFIPGGTYFFYRHRRHGVVLMEEWTYTFGSNYFRRFVRLVDGRVVDIQTGDKGQ